MIGRAPVDGGETYSDYRTIDGLVIPFESTTQSSTANNSTSFAGAANINAPGVVSRVRMPRPNVHDFSISGGTSTSVPIEIVNNHIFLHLFPDGKGPYTFVFDTGGTYIVTPEVAAVSRSGRRRFAIRTFSCCRSTGASVSQLCALLSGPAGTHVQAARLQR